MAYENTMRVTRKVFDAHSHIGMMKSWKYYGLAVEVDPTVIHYPTYKDMLKHMDHIGVERQMVISDYGIPVASQPFELNPVVVDACEHDDRFVGAIWTSPRLDMWDNNREAIKHAGDKGIKALKVTCLLGGTYKVSDWDADTKKMWEELVDCCEANNLCFHMHTSPAGGSDISNLMEFIEAYGKRIKIFIVHMGGGVSGHIKWVPRFLDYLDQGYKLWGDMTWSVGFGPRWMLATLQETGKGWDRMLFSSDTPWSDFWGEYYKIEGADISDELKQRIFYQNAVDLYDACGKDKM
jgi:uncharacterized protein